VQGIFNRHIFPSGELGELEQIRKGLLERAIIKLGIFPEKSLSTITNLDGGAGME
jgi:hypothetical protein